MVSRCKNLFYLIVILQVCLTWVAAQGEPNVTSPAEMLNSSGSDIETPTPMNVQNDEGTPQKPVETQPPLPPTPAATEAEETVQPTRPPNVHSTTAPPVVRVDATSTVEQMKNGTTAGTMLPRSEPTKKGEGGHAAISVANLALVVFSVSSLLIY